jgi:hypothetical protein
MIKASNQKKMRPVDSKMGKSASAAAMVMMKEERKK